MNKALITIGVFAFIIGIALIALTFVYIPTQTTQEYQIPKSEVIIGGWTPLAAVAPATSMAKGVSLSSGDWLNIQVNATAGMNINLYIKSDATTADYLLAGTAQTFFRNITYLNENWTVPVSSQYTFVFNSTTPFSYRDVNVLVIKQTEQTAYREVIDNVPLLPFEVTYGGVVIALSGLVMLIYGVRKQKKR